MKVLVAAVGKPPKGWVAEGLSEYTERLKGVLSIEWHFFKTDDQLIAFVKKQRQIVLLDPNGKQVTSPAFSTLFHQKIVEGGASITFVIGGSDGLPESLKSQGYLLSLSSLTFTHQMVPLILIEQIYRATEIEKGSAYHK